MKKLLASLFAAFCFIGFAHAETPDAGVVFNPFLVKFENDYLRSQNCPDLLKKSWRTFSGSYNYAEVEKQAMNNAMTATLCAVRRGYITYTLLGEVEKARLAGVVKKSGNDAALKAAVEAFMKSNMGAFNEVMTSVSCDARTPRISFSGSYENVVNVKCSSSLGPVVVDLDSMHVTIAGKDIWNGQNGSYLGRTLGKALKLPD